MQLSWTSFIKKSAPLCGLAFMLEICQGCQTASAIQSKVEARPLEVDQYWVLTPPAPIQFDASGLVRLPGFGWLTVNDKDDQIYRIDWNESSREAALVPVLTETLERAKKAHPDGDASLRRDFEGLAADRNGILYVCGESKRDLLKINPADGSFQWLRVDWTEARQYFSDADANASFEGIAVFGDHLYVANERAYGRIIALDSKDYRIVNDFQLRPSGFSLGDVHYSGLSHDGRFLYVLLREHRRLLQFDEASQQTAAEWDLMGVENHLELRFKKRFQFTGVFEGVHVEDGFVWLITDNNGMGRQKYPEDKRPVLVRCRLIR